MKQIFDILLGVAILVLLEFLMLLSAITISLTYRGLGFYWSDRVGRNNEVFKIIKFRSMRIDTPIVVTHLLDNLDIYLCPIGRLLRYSSLDELLQLFSVLKGDLSFVRPRPALYNQDDLIALRSQKGVDKLLPGSIGWTEVNVRDKLSISLV